MEIFGLMAAKIPPKTEKAMTIRKELNALLSWDPDTFPMKNARDLYMVYAVDLI